MFRTFMALVLLALANVVHADPKSATYILQTVAEPGFTHGKNVYVVGAPVADFVKRFGPPKSSADVDRGERVEKWLYYNDRGLIVITANDRVTAFRFWMVDFDPGVADLPALKAADAATDKGLRPRSTEEDLRRLHGKPRATDGLLPSVQRDLVYPWGLVTFHRDMGLMCIELRQDKP